MKIIFKEVCLYGPLFLNGKEEKNKKRSSPESTTETKKNQIQHHERWRDLKYTKWYRIKPPEFFLRIA